MLFRPFSTSVRSGHLAALSAVLLVAGSLGCAGVGAPAHPGTSPIDVFALASSAPARGPGSLFPTIEAAALDALNWSHRGAQLRDRGRLRVGTISLTTEGYRYSESRRSQARFASNSPVGVRYELGPDDVATYIIHPRTNRPEINQHNERPTEREKRLVDERDPHHRPLYILTPSRKVVRYANGRSVRLVIDPGLPVASLR